MLPAPKLTTTVAPEILLLLKAGTIAIDGLCPNQDFFNAENYSIEYILIVQVDLSHEQFFIWVKSIRANNFRANNEGSLGGRIAYMPMHSTTQASVCVSIGRQKTIKYALYTA